MLATSTTAAATFTYDPEHLDRNIVHRCCSLTIAGVHCRQAAQRGSKYCNAHNNRAPRAFENPGSIVIPLLEDASAIRLTSTKVVHALANGYMQPPVANAITRSLSVAASTLPRPPRLKSADEPRREPALFRPDPFGTWIAPCEPFLDDNGNITTWDALAEPRTLRRHAHEVRIDPAAALTESYKQVITDLIRQKAAQEAAATAAALDAGLPNPHPHDRRHDIGKCPFGTQWCGGPWRPHHCACCTGDNQRSPHDPRHPGDEVVALVTALRNHLQQQQAASPTSAPATEITPDPATAQQPQAQSAEPTLTPDLALNLKAAAENPRPCRTNRTAAKYKAQNRTAATRKVTQSKVVKLIHIPTHNIPKHKKLATRENTQKCPNELIR